MDFRLTKEQESFQEEVRDFLKREVTDEIVQETYDQIGGIGPRTWELLRKLGAKRWLCLSWPEEYGGLGRSNLEQFILWDELAYFKAMSTRPVGACIAGPTIIMYGNDEQKKEYLTRIASGETEFALGYTEPQAGSDLASLEMRAVEDGDCFVMNGQKVFNSACHYSDYHWLAARTDPEARKHRGISLFIVDMKSPGITIRPLHGISGIRTNEVFYDDVRVPKKNLVGELNRGWYYMATALDLERTYSVGEFRVLFEELLEYVKENEGNVKDKAREVLIKNELAQRKVELEVGNIVCYRLAWMVGQHQIPVFEAAMGKLFTSELSHRLSNTGMRALELYGEPGEGSKWASLRADVEQLYLDAIRKTIVAGTSEIQRNIIALRGLELPRA